MAGVITSLRFQQRGPERVNVYLDHEFAFAVSAVEAARLRVGDLLDDAAIERLKTSDLRQKAYDRAARYLSFRPRSAVEVRRYLSRAGYADDVIEDAVARLAEHGYLDDAEFARYWVENRLRFRPKGRPALQQELHQRGLERETVESALAGIDLADAAYRAAQSRAQRLAPLAAADPGAFRRKLGEFLLRRGFDFDLVRDVVNRVTRELGQDAGADSAEQEP